jgi:flavodoxin
MPPPGRILVVAYSRSGHTRKLGERIARELGADFEPIEEKVDRAGAWGFTRSAFEAMLRTPTFLKAPVKDPAAYDLVVVGTPVWSASVSTPVRTYLKQFKGHFTDVAFFVTHGGSGAERTFEQMARLTGRNPIESLAVTEVDLAKGDDAEKARGFVQALGVGLHSTVYQPSPPKRGARRGRPV